jgi:hypothetical protein
MVAHTKIFRNNLHLFRGYRMGKQVSESAPAIQPALWPTHNCPKQAERPADSTEFEFPCRKLRYLVEKDLCAPRGHFGTSFRTDASASASQRIQ